MKQHTIILYIPFWEDKAAFTEQQTYYQKLAESHSLVVIFDGIPVVQTSLKYQHNTHHHGLIHSLRKISVSSPHISILRLGVRPTHEELRQTYTQACQYDAVFVGLEYAQDGFITMNRKSYRLFLSIESRLYSMGYGIAAHALWERQSLSCSSIQIKQHRVQQPDAHRIQICSNILCAWLKNKKLHFFAHRSPPAWYAPIEDTISIIIPIWNNLPLLKTCVQSILKCTVQPFELILVDNASQEAVQPWAQQLSATHPHIIYIQNNINHGFPQGCNIGMQRAQGTHLVLLNSDTIVTPYWLCMLVAALREENVGLVSGMSCNIGLKDQCISSPPYKKTKEMLLFAQKNAAQHHGKYTQSTLVVFLMVLIRGALKEKIGGLDPIFSFGNCEDSDYCFRAYRAGYKSLVMHDVYIDHVGSASFHQQTFSYEQLIHQNIQYAIGKNIPPPLHDKYQHASIDESWASLRSFDERWDVLPLSIKDYTHRAFSLLCPFSPKESVLMFPHPQEPWRATVAHILKTTSLHCILRVDPPTPSYINHVLSQCAQLSEAEQKRIHIEKSSIPTKYRKSIYDLAEYYIPPARFDAFFFMRESEHMTIKPLVVQQ